MSNTLTSYIVKNKHNRSRLAKTKETLVQSFPKAIIITGGKKYLQSPHATAIRSKRSFVQKVFIPIAHVCTSKDVQNLLYLDLYREICKRTLTTPSKQTSAHQKSPYFIQEKKTKMRHQPLAMRFKKLIMKRMICLKLQNTFQLACCLQNLWDEAIQIAEQQQGRGTNLFTTADAVLQSAKALPQSLTPLEEKQSLLHVSSVDMGPKKSMPKLKPSVKGEIETFITNLIAFGFEFYKLK
jgi:hypothetical protein